MKRILVFGMTENPGGVESFLVNYIRRLDRKRFTFGFLCNSYDKIAYEDELLTLGFQTYHITARSKDYRKYKREMTEFFRKYAEEYDTIWVNVNSLANIDYLKYAKRYGIGRRIIHSHNSQNMDSRLRGLLHAYNKRKIHKYATDFWACSTEAGHWFYSDAIMNSSRYEVIKNAIDMEPFRHNPDVRAQYRSDLGVTDKFVIGNVGRLQFQKNQMFLLDIFACVLKQRPEAYLWLIGQGEDEEKIRTKIAQLGIGDQVSLLGVRADVPALLSAMDVFLFPSVFEGLSVALTEAQASGLVCIASKEGNPAEARITKQLRFVSLHESPEAWADIICRTDCRADRNDLFEQVRKSGFDITQETQRLERLLERK